MENIDSTDLRALPINELTKIINLYPWFGNARKELFSRLLSLGDKAVSLDAYTDAAMYSASRKLLSKDFRDAYRHPFKDNDAEKLIKTLITANTSVHTSTDTSNSEDTQTITSADADANIDANVSEGINEDVNEGVIENTYARPESDRKIYVVGGDYFTQAQYDNVKNSDAGNIFSAFSNHSKYGLCLSDSEITTSISMEAKPDKHDYPDKLGKLDIEPENGITTGNDIKSETLENITNTKNTANITNTENIANTTNIESLDFYTETLARIYADQGYFEEATSIYSKLILAYPEKSAYFADRIRDLGSGMDLDQK